MNRMIQPHAAVFIPVPVNVGVVVRDWLQNRAGTYRLKWLLAHADDGVIWGKVEPQGLITSDAIAPEVSPPLRAETVQQARLFADHAELLLWRDGDDGWAARLIRDALPGDTPDWVEAIDEPQIVFGTDPQCHDRGFTVISDGAQGLHHAVPLDVRQAATVQSRPLRLYVRHYIHEDAQGFARIVASRLLGLSMETP